MSLKKKKNTRPRVDRLAMLCNRNPIHFPRQLAGPKNQRKHNKIKIQSSLPLIKKKTDTHTVTHWYYHLTHINPTASHPPSPKCMQPISDKHNPQFLSPPPWGKSIQCCCRNLPPSAPISHCGEWNGGCCHCQALVAPYKIGAKRPFMPGV